jgi:hypothetical protein
MVRSIHSPHTIEMRASAEIDGNEQPSISQPARAALEKVRDNAFPKRIAESPIIGCAKTAPPAETACLIWFTTSASDRPVTEHSCCRFRSALSAVQACRVPSDRDPAHALDSGCGGSKELAPVQDEAGPGKIRDQSGSRSELR